MIYFHSNEGKKNVYTKLDDVLEINKPNDQIANEGYEVLGKTVNNNYQNFTQKLIDLQNKPAMQPYKKPEFQKTIQKDANNINLGSTRFKNSAPVIVTERSKEEKFLQFFTNAIKNNADVIKNSENCVNEINKKFIKITNKGENKIENTDEKLDFRLKYQKEDQDFLEKINAKVEKNRRIYGGETESEKSMHNEVQNTKVDSRKKETHDRHYKLKKKFEKILMDALNYLYFNKISISEFFNKNPFPLKPFGLKYSYEFFEAVKFNRKAEVEELLKINKAYLFEFDYFHQTGYHWAAKRGYKELLDILIRKGNHINQYDNNRRTPLWLAAKNNHFDACAILMAYGANPFLDNKDGKKPVEVTTDPNVRKLIIDHMEKHSELNSTNYFKSNVLKKHKNDVINLLKKD